MSFEMDTRILLILSCMILATSAWSRPFYPVARRPMRFTRFAPPPPPHLHPNHHHGHPQLHSQPHSQPHVPPHHKSPVDTADLEEQQWQRPKRGHHDYDHDHDHRGTSGVTGPVHTFVKTDKNANYKWGVRHHVGDKYAS